MTGSLILPIRQASKLDKAAMWCAGNCFAYFDKSVARDVAIVLMVVHQVVAYGLVSHLLLLLFVERKEKKRLRRYAFCKGRVGGRLQHASHHKLLVVSLVPPLHL